MPFWGGLLTFFATNCAFATHYHFTFRTNRELYLQWYPPLTLTAFQTSIRANNRGIREDYPFPPPIEWAALTSGSQQRLRQLLSWESISKFDYKYIFEVDELTNGHSLLFISWAIFTSSRASEMTRNDAFIDGYNFMDTYDLDPLKFLDFVRVIEEQYRENPYHNRVHCADVVQTLHSLIQSMEDSIYSDLQLLSILLAAIVHDVGHDGTSNEFQIQIQSSLAIRCKNESVLENYHIDIGLKEIANSGLLNHLSLSVHEKIQIMIRDAVLHTDMALHQKQVDDAEQRLQGSEQKDASWKSLVYLMHLSDISNSAKSTFLKWTENILEEFFQLGDRQRDLHFEVSGTNDRLQVDRSTSQRNFIKFVVFPAFVKVKFEDNRIMDALRHNLGYWESQIEKF
jgi:hypothetical protein